MRTHLLTLCFLALALLASALPGRAAAGEYLLSDFGDISTPQLAEATYRKAGAEILAKGGGTLIIPSTAPPAWTVVNDFQQTTAAGPVITVLDLRYGYRNLLVPSLGITSGTSAWASERVTRIINQHEKSLPFQTSTYANETRNLVPHGASSYMQYSSEAVPAGKDQRVYVPTIRGIYVGQFINITGKAYSYAQPYDQVYIKDLGWDKAKNMPYFVVDLKHPHPKWCIVYNKHVAGIMHLENETMCNNQTMDFQVTKRQYAQGDNFVISASLFNQGDVFSGLGDEVANVFNAETIFDAQSFHSFVEKKDPAKDEIIFTAKDTEFPYKLASCRPLVNLNQKKWITAGKVLVVAPEDWAGFFVAPEVLEKDGMTVDMAKLKAYKGEKPPVTSWQGLEVKKLNNVYQGKAYPSILRDSLNYLGGRIIGSADCGWTKEIVGRYFAISDTSECITPKDGNAGYAGPDPRRNVYRWYLIRDFTENPDGTKCLRIERIRWAAVNAGAPLLYDRNNYTRDGHEKPLSYIIAPGAFVTDVSEGWVDRYWSSPADPRKIKISVSPDKGSRFDFEAGDPIELGIGADPANPNGLRVRFHNQVPSTMEDSTVSLMNLSRVAMNSAVGIGGATFSLEDVQRQKDKQPSFLAGIRLGSATNTGISFDADVVDEALLFRQPHDRAQPIRWLYDAGTRATTLSVNPKTGTVEFAGGNLNLNKASLEKVGGLSATAVRARNLRGISVKVAEGSTTLTVTYPQVEADAAYSLTVQPSWMTMDCVTKKTATGFTVQFSAPAPAGATVDWQLIR
ncbi:MAG: hypothetical protein ACYC7E_20960 [Armatimonadota bacterium]